MYSISDLNGKPVFIVGTMGGTIHIWDAAKQKSVVKLQGHATAPKVFKYDKINSYLISGGEDTKIKVWDLRTNQRQALSTFKEHLGIITCLDLSLDSKLLVSGAEDGSIKVWDMQNFKLSSSVKVGTPASSFPLCLALKNDNVGTVCGLATGLLNKTIKYY